MSRHRRDDRVGLHDLRPCALLDTFPQRGRCPAKLEPRRLPVFCHRGFNGMAHHPVRYIFGCVPIGREGNHGVHRSASCHSDVHASRVDAWTNDRGVRTLALDAMDR